MLRLVISADSKAVSELSREHELAREVQERTFPSRTPRVKGFEVFGRTQPATINDGDFYDAIGVAPREGDRGFVLNPAVEVDHLVLTLGDATGHGMSAALMATELRALLRASIRLGVFHTDLSALINGQLHDDLADEHFITLLMGRLDAAERMFRWVSFGQGPIWYYRAVDQTIIDLDAHLPPLGILPELAPYAPTETRFASGDILLALSDGFPEARAPDQSLLGEIPLRTVLQQQAERPLSEIADALWATLERHRGSAPISDDRTLLMVRCDRD